ncbi:MAG: AmmeMemoRadiSam system protein B [Acidobacteriota bacterium]
MGIRPEIDGFPSNDPRQPGLVLHDPTGIATAMLLIPPALVPALAEEPLPPELAAALSEAGFLEDDNYARLLEAFARAETLPARHGGPGNYPTEGVALRQLLGTWFAEPGVARPLHAIAAPHASPEPARGSYVSAYAALAASLPRAEAAGKTFVVLGTSHQGARDRFGMTRKRFVTPVGETRTRVPEPLAKLAALEDPCFAVEHSIEFQVVFLQFLYGPDIEIVPILCGPLTSPRHPFLEALGEWSAREGDRLRWVLGVDMAHKGPRYGDREARRAYTDSMAEIEQRDRGRITALAAGDREAFWTQVRERNDDLNWCGTAPFYSYLAAHPRARGELLTYEHWQIDPRSVVTFAGMTFSASGGGRAPEDSVRLSTNDL